ncbi:MAG: DUF192 domain-containing protein [Treponema sp.]|jgi:uncharacterized membrane protein (UPF0127 family)|nr:DUF192 domain-containing protein [Treponema sp.]
MPFSGRPLFRAALPALMLFLCCLLLGGTGESKTLETRDLIIEREEGDPVILRAEIARSAEEKQKGLMFRKNLADGQGMLFVFDRDQIMSFYMKNTLVPLSIAFIRSDGGIVEIRDMRPLDESLIRSSRSVRYALEVPQGWFDRAGIKTGDCLLLSGL